MAEPASELGEAISDDAAKREGLRALATIAAVLVVSALVPYAVPGLERERAWIAGEPIPVLHLYGLSPAEQASPASPPGPSEEAIAEALAEPVIPEPAPPVAPGEVREVRIEPSELEGLGRTIEDPSGHAMDAFYAQLLRTARGEEGAITRVAHFGDSTIALDGITMTVREALQLRFGDAGHGFVLAAHRPLPYRHFQVRHDDAGNWALFDLTHLGLSDGRYGLGGVQVRSSSGASAFFETDRETGRGSSASAPSVGGSVSSFQILYQRYPRGGNLQTRVDDGAWATLDTSGELSDEVHRIEVPDGPHRLSIRTAGHGSSRLYGVVLERSGPGVVYDSLGIVGARASRMLGFDPAHLRTQLAQRETNLVVVGFGGNDADDNRSEEEFFAIFRDVARLVREARPEASCLLFAPLDQAERDERGRIATLAPVPRIVRASRRAAEAEGCAFFDTWSAMGGEGAMERWYRHSPRLSSSDFRHATPAGYRVIGNLFYRALLAGLRDRLPRAGEGAPAGE